MACTQCTCGTCPEGRACPSTSAIRIRRDEAAEESRRLDERDCPTVFSDYFAEGADGGASPNEPNTMPPETEGDLPELTDAELLARIRAVEAARRRARTGMIVLGGTSSALILWHIWTRRTS